MLCSYNKQGVQVIWQKPHLTPLAVKGSTPNRTSIRSAVFAQSILATDRLTDARIIDRNSSHLMYSTCPNMLTYTFTVTNSVEYI